MRLFLGWRGLKVINKVYVFRFVSAWLAIAPIMVYATANAPERLFFCFPDQTVPARAFAPIIVSPTRVLECRGSTYSVRIGLPFSAHLSVAASLLLLIGYGCFQMYCPRLVKNTDSYSDYLDRKGNDTTLLSEWRELIFSELVRRQERGEVQSMVLDLLRVKTREPLVRFIPSDFGAAHEGVLYAYEPANLDSSSVVVGTKHRGYTAYSWQLLYSAFEEIRDKHFDLYEELNRVAALRSEDVKYFWTLYVVDQGPPTETRTFEFSRHAQTLKWQVLGSEEGGEVPYTPLGIILAGEYKGVAPLRGAIRTKVTDLKMVGSPLDGFFLSFADFMPFLLGPFRFEITPALGSEWFHRLYENVSRERLRSSHSFAYVLSNTATGFGLLLWGVCLVSHLAGMVRP